MRNSDPLIRLGVVAAIGLHAFSHADEVTLSSQGKVTGTVHAIGDSGVVEMSTPNSPEPIQIKAGRVEKVQFDATPDSRPPATTLLELVNGDTLPVTVEKMDATDLHVTTPDAGSMVISRSILRSMQLGVRGRKSIYLGPRNQQEWSRGAGGANQWSFSNGALVANGPAYASRDFETPRQFILKFNLKWQGAPSYQIYFADPMKPRGEKADRYFMQFNAAGMEIKRESTTQNRAQTVILLAKTPDQFPRKTVEVEIRVNRKSSRMHLLLDGEQEAAGVDPLTTAPVGGGIQLLNSSPPGGSQEIRDIEILEFDNVRTRHKAEDRGDVKTDSLISRDDDRWGGRLERVGRDADGCVFYFKSDFQDQPLEMVENDVSTIFFAEAEPAPAIDAPGPYVLKLRGEGSLKVVSCKFGKDSVSAKHPLLGEMEIPRAGIAAMERAAAKPEQGEEP